jgi:hypothetical protein
VGTGRAECIDMDTPYHCLHKPSTYLARPHTLCTYTSRHPTALLSGRMSVTSDKVSLPLSQPISRLDSHPPAQIGTIQRRLAWPLRKDDMIVREGTTFLLLFPFKPPKSLFTLQETEPDEHPIHTLNRFLAATFLAAPRMREGCSAG